MILVLNCGSQSVKWKLFDNNLKAVKRGSQDFSCLPAGRDYKNFQVTLLEELEKISKEKISAIGHRIVHGGKKFKEPIKITQNILEELEKTSNLAPLHNPYNILGIKTAQKIFPEVDNFAVFDTEFFKDLPEYVSTYALPIHIAKEFGFKRYGFHGTSHEFVANEAALQIDKPFEELKIITCHLGGGCSVAAIKNGKAVDVSMGFTPMEGLVMMTRAGDIDSGIVLDLAESFGPEKTREILDSESGIRGICGDSDMLKVLQRLEISDKKAKLAFDVFVYSVKKYIGSYFAILGGCDLLVFTGAIGSGLAVTRDAICKDLNILTPRGPSKKPGSTKGGTKILAIETDEELAIAQKINKIKS